MGVAATARPAAFPDRPGPARVDYQAPAVRGRPMAHPVRPAQERLACPEMVPEPVDMGAAATACPDSPGPARGVFREPAAQDRPMAHPEMAPGRAGMGAAAPASIAAFQDRPEQAREVFRAAAARGRLMVHPVRTAQEYLACPALVPKRADMEAAVTASSAAFLGNPGRVRGVFLAAAARGRPMAHPVRRGQGCLACPEMAPVRADMGVAATASIAAFQARPGQTRAVYQAAAIWGRPMAHPEMAPGRAGMGAAAPASPAVFQDRPEQARVVFRAAAARGRPMAQPVRPVQERLAWPEMAPERAAMGAAAPASPTAPRPAARRDSLGQLGMAFQVMGPAAALESPPSYSTPQPAIPAPVCRVHREAIPPRLTMGAMVPLNPAV